MPDKNNDERWGDVPARRILCTPGTRSGAPRIEGTRLICQDIVRVAGWGELDSHWPEIDAASVRNCVDYCASRQCLEEAPLRFCGGCTLDLWRLEDLDRFVDEESVGMWRVAQEIRRRDYNVSDGLPTEFWSVVNARFREDEREAERCWRQYGREFSENGASFPNHNRDPLTQLYNRDCGEALLERLRGWECEGFLLKAKVEGATGELLAKTARALERFCPRETFLYFCGDAEFGVIYPNAEPQDAQLLAQKTSEFLASKEVRVGVAIEPITPTHSVAIL